MKDETASYICAPNGLIKTAGDHCNKMKDEAASYILQRMGQHPVTIAMK
jgi:hypothetical protein